MKNTVFIFHGTEGHPQENWFPWLKERIEETTENWQVIVPHFPSPPVVPAKIDEWFEVFDGCNEHLNENSIIVGHSLGGVFTLRVLERIKHPIKASFLVGTPVGVRPILNYDRDSNFSGFEFDWETIKSKSGEFFVYQSDDDPYVGIGNGEQLAQCLGTELVFISNAGHFNAKAGYTEFEDLLNKLKPLL